MSIIAYYINKKVKQYAVGCDYCKKLIGNKRLITLTLKKVVKGINGRRQWETVRKQQFHQQCFYKKRARKI